VPTLKLRDLAGAIEARLEGDPEVSVSGVAPLERAGPGARHAGLSRDLRERGSRNQGEQRHATTA